MNVNTSIVNLLKRPEIDVHLKQNDQLVDDLYKLIFEQSAIPGVVFSNEGTILVINKALEELYGSSMSQLINQYTLEDLFHQRQRKRVVDYYSFNWSKQNICSEFIFICYNGEERNIELKIQPVNYSNLLYAILIDITKYKIYETRVQELVDQISVINEIVKAVNSNLNKNQLIGIFFNQISKIFGYDLAYILLCDIEDKELEIHLLKDASEIDSRKSIGSFCQSFTKALSLCHYIEQNREKIYTIIDMLGLKNKEEYKSITLIQLKTDEQLIGAIILFRLTENTLTQYHINIFQEISDQIAIAFMKARLFYRYQQSLTNLSFLAKINETISSSLDLDEVLRQLVESSQQMMQAKICTIHFLKTEYESIESLAGSFDDKYIDQFRPQIQQVILNQKPLIVENVDYNSIQFFKNRAEIQPLGLKSLIVLPVIANDKTIALLSVFLDKVHYFSEHEIELLSMLADQAAIAIRNAELYKKVEGTKNFLESIIHSSTHIIVSIDLEGKTTFFNNSACQLTGYLADEVLNQPFFERFVKNGRTLFAGLKRTLFIENKLQTFECKMLRKDRQAIPISWTFSPLINQKKETIGTLGIGKHISKQKQIREHTSLSTKRSLIISNKD